MNPQQDKDKPGDSAHDRAVALLARREHSRRELAQKLERKGFDQSDIAAALDKLIAENYLSEQRYGEMLVRSRVAQAYGPVRIRAELRSHGLDDSLVAALLAEAEQETDWSQLATRALDHRYGNKPADDFAESSKRARFLVRRGFPADIARQASLLRQERP